MIKNNTIDDAKFESTVLKLKAKNIKLTDIRIKIIKLIIKNQHLNIQEIIELLQKNDETTNVMSVYNTIDLLLKEHIIFSNTFDGKNIWYELSSNKAIHIKCDSCGSVQHVSKEKQDSFNTSELKKLLSSDMIKIEHVKIEIHVICESCNDQQ